MPFPWGYSVRHMDELTQEPAHVDVQDIHLTFGRRRVFAGLSCRFAQNQVTVIIGASGGVLIHHFSLPNDSGTRTDAVVTIPLSLTRRLSDRLELGIRLAPGFSDESREHTQGGQQLWQRSGARLEALGQLSWRL